jgi:hypothetical protein
LALAGAVLLLAQLGGCSLVREPISSQAADPHHEQEQVSVVTPPPPVVPFETPPPPAPPPPVVEELPPPPPVPVRHFQLGAAATALVETAHRQASGGNTGQAITTIERALRIEPDNPLLWIELGSVHQSAGRYDQAGSMGRKALQLATGDPQAQSGAWHLIAESFKARDRNQEALEAQQKADELAAR